ncbi:MAG: alpha/beta fold hydrolase [Candidatus Woesearchaeota archaeon]
MQKIKQKLIEKKQQNNKQKNKVLIFHGWGSSKKDNWFPWLNKNLKKENFIVNVPNLPNSRFPKLNEWLDCAFDLEINEKTILVGHSLGSVLILRILENLDFKLKAVFLVSSFDVNLGIDEIKNFVDKPFNYEKIKKNCENIYILQSDNDKYIDLKIAENLAKKINAKLIIFHNKNHLSQGTSIKNNMYAFPELKELILKLK